MFDRVIAGFDGFDGGRDAIALWQHLAPAPPRSRCPVIVSPRPAVRRASRDVDAASTQEAS